MDAHYIQQDMFQKHMNIWLDLGGIRIRGTYKHLVSLSKRDVLHCRIDWTLISNVPKTIRQHFETP